MLPLLCHWKNQLKQGYSSQAVRKMQPDCQLLAVLKIRDKSQNARLPRLAEVTIQLVLLADMLELRLRILDPRKMLLIRSRLIEV